MPENNNILKYDEGNQTGTGQINLNEERIAENSLLFITYVKGTSIIEEKK